MITIPVGFFTPAVTGTPSPYDPDAQAFFTQAAAVGGTLTQTEIDAVNQLVLDYKAAGIWTETWGLYPFVGSTGPVCELNLRYPTEPSSTLNFIGTWDFSNDGIQLTGASGYADGSGYGPNAFTGDHHVYRYVNRVINNGDCQYDGTRSAPPAGSESFLIMGKCGLQLEWFSGGSNATVGGGPTAGYAQAINRTSTTFVEFWRELSGVTGSVYVPFSVYTTRTNTQGTLTSNDYLLGKISTLTQYYNKDGTGFYSMGTGLTTQQMQALHIAASRFATTLGRDYAPFDGDAAAYISAVETAGGTLTYTQKTAINDLYLDLKAAGLYTKIKAMYPMMGGTTGSVAVEGIQPGIKDITWNGNIAADTSGVVIATGSTGYGDIPINPSIDYSGYVNSNHISYYSLTSAGSGDQYAWDVGVGNATTGAPLYGLILRRAVDNSFTFDAGNYPSGRLSTTSTDASGFVVATAPSASSKKIFRNGSLVTSNTTTTSGTDFNANFWLFRINSVPATTINYVYHKCAFLSIGLGLSDAEAGDLETAVNAFQTTLGRNTY